MAKRNDKLESRSTTVKSSKLNKKSGKFPYYRQLKVRKSYYFYQYHDFQPRTPFSIPESVPWINIQGYWLNEAGFSIGTLVRVKISQGRIVLTPMKVSSI